MAPSNSNRDLQVLLARTQNHALAFLTGLDRRPVAATVDYEVLQRRLNVQLTESGVPATSVIDELVAATNGGHLGSESGRFFGWVIGGALPSALAADWLTSAWDNNATLYACGPAAAVCEEIAGAWIKDILKLPNDSSFAFTTGCQMAHLTCLAAARRALLAERGWDVGRDGLFKAPPIRILATALYHGSITRAVQMLGIGAGAVESLSTDDQGRVTRHALSTALRKTDVPTIVILDAGDLSLGAIDRFDELVPMARAAGAWVHVDGAFGLWARVSRRFGGMLNGVEKANSWATDAHKWLNTPKDIGVAIISDPVSHTAAMGITAPYLEQPADSRRDPIDWTPDWTRRARGFPVYAALRELGRGGLADLIDRCCEHAYSLTNGIAALEGAELVASPTLNQGLVRFLDRRQDATKEDHDHETVRMIAAINAEGTAFFSGTTWNGRQVMRISVVNWRTTGADVETTLASVQQILAAQAVAIDGRE